MRSSSSHSWPWTVHVYQIGVNVSTDCGGVLISPMHVLTAAHCVDEYNYDPFTVKVKFDNYNFESLASWFDSGFRGVAAIHLHFASHESSDAISRDQVDLAIIELEYPFFWTPPICLPYNTEEHIQVNSMLIFTGYAGGRILNLHPKTIFNLWALILGFHETEVQVRDAKRCSYEHESPRLYQIYRPPRPPTLEQHCSVKQKFSVENLYNLNLSFVWRFHPFLCSEKMESGDSGGPLMMQTGQDSWTLIALAISASRKPISRIVNFCNGDSEEFTYSEHQLVAPFLPWIRKVLEDANWQ